MRKLLSTMPPRLTAMAPRLGRLPGDEKARLRERDQTVEWRKMYFTTQWRELRKVALLRDAYTCQQTGVICDGKYPASNSPVVHHKRRHHGDPMLFFDIDNVETVSKVWHDSDAQRQERAEQGW